MASFCVIFDSVEAEVFTLRNRLRTHFTQSPRSTFNRKNPYADIPCNSRVICFGDHTGSLSKGDHFFFQLSAFPFLYLNPYQHWPSTHVTLHLVALHLALLFQVGRHHDRLGVPLSSKVTFYLREEPTALSPSLAHIITFVQSGSRKMLTIPLSIVVAFQTYP